MKCATAARWSCCRTRLRIPSISRGWKEPSRRFDQIFDAIQFKSIVNLKGELPTGYQNAGAKTVDGVGKVTTNGLAAAVDDDQSLAQMRALAEEVAAIWGSLSAIQEPERRQELLQRYGARLINKSNRYATLMEELGLRGPYAGG